MSNHPENLDRQALLARHAGSGTVAPGPQRPGTRRNGLTRFAGQRRADWWATPPRLIAPGLVLREPVDGDAAALHDLMSDGEVARYLSPGPATLEETRAFIDWVRRAREAGRYLCFAVHPEESQGIVGLFQVWPIDPTFRSAEWGFVLERGRWGSGLFQRCAQLVSRYTFETLGTRRIEGRSAVENERGNAALRKLGAEPEGLLRRCFECTGGVVRDHLLWTLYAEPQVTPPAS